LIIILNSDQIFFHVCSSEGFLAFTYICMIRLSRVSLQIIVYHNYA